MQVISAALAVSECTRYFIETDLWELRDKKMVVIVSLVRQVEKVKFTYEKVPSESVTVPCFFLGAILSHEQPALKTVCIKDCNPEAIGEVLLSQYHTNCLVSSSELRNYLLQGACILIKL